MAAKATSRPSIAYAVSDTFANFATIKISTLLNAMQNRCRLSAKERGCPCHSTLT